MRKGLAVLLAAVVLLCLGGCKNDNYEVIHITEEPVVTVYLLTERVCGEEKTVYTYNENGEKTLVIEYWGEKENERMEYAYTYNELGRVSEMVYFYGGQKDNPTRTVYTYDEQGRCIEQVSEGEESRMYLYDAAGELSQSVRYDSNGAELSRIGYFYDDKGNLLKVSYGEYHYKEYTYDSSGKLVRETAYYEEMVYFRTEFEYNSQGELTKAVRTGEDGTQETLTYQKVQITRSWAKNLALDSGIPNVIIQNQ